MSDNPPLQSSSILYQMEDGRTRIQCRFEDGTIWLTQAQIAELFQTMPQNGTLHLKAIFAEGELTEAATCKDYLQVRQEGNREVTRSRCLHPYGTSGKGGCPNLALKHQVSRLCPPGRIQAAKWKTCAGGWLGASGCKFGALRAYHPSPRGT